MNWRSLASHSYRAWLGACVLTVLCSLAPALSSAAQVTLAWDPNTETDLAGYKLYSGPSTGLYPFGGVVVNLTTYRLSGLLEGGPYFFPATAYNLNVGEVGFLMKGGMPLAT